MKTKTKVISFLAFFILIALIVRPVMAQTPEPVYQLHVQRDFGFGAGADIRGLFTVSIVGSADIKSVTFLIDGKQMTVVNTSPYKYQFNTSQYPFGWHDLTAEVTNTAGDVFTTTAQRFNFVTSAMETQSMKRIVLPILGLVFGVIIIIGAVQFIVMRKRPTSGVEPGTQRNYGYAGGSICKYCGRPTPRHVWGFNMLAGKLDRCENCGRWSIMRAVPLEVLRKAEQDEKITETAKPVISEKTDEEKLRDMIEKSKYD